MSFTAIVSASKSSKTFFSKENGETSGSERTDISNIEAMKAHKGTNNYWPTQRSTAARLVPILLITNVPTLILFNLLLFRYIHAGMEEIPADHVHHEVT